METIVLVLVLAVLVSAVPKPTHLHFRNVFKPPVGNIKLKPNPRIVGGEEAEPHAIPYQAFLELHSSYKSWYCAGSLISENYVLTTATCGYGADEVLVTLGKHSLLVTEETEVTLLSTNIKIHEDYDNYLVINDICVIKLPYSVTFTNAIQPVALPTRADTNNTYEGIIVRASGWGVTDRLSLQMSSVLNYVDVKIISNSLCEGYFGDLPDSNLCTSGDNDHSLCTGDPGDPLVLDGVQVGIFSFMTVLCKSQFPSGFSRVTSFLDWIAENTDIPI